MKEHHLHLSTAPLLPILCNIHPLDPLLFIERALTELVFFCYNKSSMVEAPDR